MSKEQVIGFDLNEKYCQVSFFDEKSSEPKTLEVATDKYQIPLMLAWDGQNWKFGREAKKMSVVGKGYIVDDLWNRACKHESVQVDNKEYEAVWLLAKFVELVLKPFENIKYLAFTMEDITEDTRNLLKSIGANFGVPKENILIQDYKESFCHYMFYQPKELWQYEAALFCCDKERVEAYMLRKLNTANRKELFVAVEKVAEAQMEELASVYPVLNVDKAKYADERFKKFIQNVFENKMISSVFLIGEGFENNWYPNSLKVLCNGRRGFLGNNLYSKGAYYAAFRLTLEKDDGPIYLDETKMTEQISIRMKVDGNDGWYPLVPWGMQLYESDKQWEVLVEDSADMEIHVESLLTGELKIVPIDLSGLPERKNYAVRLKINTIFMNEYCCKVIFTDIGFGEFFASSGFEKEVLINVGGRNGQLNSMS